MRRGGPLFLVGILLALVAAFGLYYFLQGSSGGQAQDPTLQTPTVEPKKKVVVARIDIPSTTVLTDSETFLNLEDIPESQYNTSPGQYFTSFSELRNKQTVRQITAGDILRNADVTEAGLSLQIPAARSGQPRPKAFAFQVNSLTGVADQIKTGDFVDVLASFELQGTELRAGVNELGQATIKEQPFTGRSTKTLVQNVQVLQILKPQAAPSGTPGAEGGPPPEPTPAPPPAGSNASQSAGGPAPTAPGTTYAGGSWLLVLAVTDQQAEIIKFAVEQTGAVSLVLRGRGDTTQDTTIGATLDLLVSQFGLPVPKPVVEPSQTAVAATTPTPTTTP